MIEYKHLKKILFKLEPEMAHNVTMLLLRSIGGCTPILNTLKSRYFITDDTISQEIFGYRFQNPVGLAAGLDKNGQIVTQTPALGFGFSEIGTVTPKPQVGNPKPRLFRLIDEESLQNAMGFNNKGSYEVLKNLKKLYFLDYPVGINIGKNKTTPQDRAIDDYISLIKAFDGFGAYFTINISSPNTPNLRDLQNEQFIKALFSEAKSITNKPIVLKISPDISIDIALELIDSAIGSGADGIIATNTTIDYSLCSNCKEFGGLSGKLLKEKSRVLFEQIGKNYYNKTLLISVGGIDSPQEAYERIKLGASLVEIYTPFIYHGPRLIKEINEYLIRAIKIDGFRDISETIGSKWA